MRQEPKFTPTQTRILEVLSDGLMHPKCQLQACLNDDMATDRTLSVHLTYLRQILNPRGEDIVFINAGIKGRGYRHIRYISSTSLEEIAASHKNDPD